MSINDKKNRFKVLSNIPWSGRVDHRFLLDKDGKSVLLSSLSRDKRREIARKSKKIAEKYRNIILSFFRSGPGFENDKLIRQLAYEYTHRFASSGTETQPASFFFFEPFLDIKLIQGSFAPYTAITEEGYHLFNIPDFFEFLTSKDSGDFSPTSLFDLQDGKTFHFSANGSPMDFCFMNSNQREFVLSGFSMIRRRSSLYWYLIGGEVLDEEEWGRRCSDQATLNPDDAPPEKRKFLEDGIKEFGGASGIPLELEGTHHAHKTIIGGEFDLRSEKHINRCFLQETERMFFIRCDEPLVFERSNMDTEDLLQAMEKHLEESAVLWNIAEGFFQLPSYFSYKLSLREEVFDQVVSKGKLKGGKGLKSKYQVVSAIEIENKNSEKLIRAALLPHYKTEADGHWRRLAFGKLGKDREGNEIVGKTWVNSPVRKASPPSHQTVYVKDRLSAAKLKIQEYEEATQKISAEDSSQKTNSDDSLQELYIMRCAAMEEQIFKVGWTAGRSSERAEQLSRATGVPLSFIVVKSWRILDAESLEKDVHIMLAPYSINEKREFFLASLDKIKGIIEEAIQRSRKDF